MCDNEANCPNENSIFVIFSDFFALDTVKGHHSRLLNNGIFSFKVYSLIICGSKPLALRAISMLLSSCNWEGFSHYKHTHLVISAYSFCLVLSWSGNIINISRTKRVCLVEVDYVKLMELSHCLEQSMMIIFRINL